VSGGGGGAGGGGARSPQSAFPGTKLLCHAQALENGYKRLLAGFGGLGHSPRSPSPSGWLVEVSGGVRA